MSSIFDSIEVCCKNYVVRTLTINEVTIKVASLSLLNYITDENNEIKPEFTQLDNQISCYVETMKLIEMNDEQLIQYVKENYYD